MGRPHAPDSPFLSVVIPVGVVGTEPLRESLLSLVGQDDVDFEVVLVMGAGTDTQDSRDLEEVASDQPPRLASRLRLVEAEAATPGAVRNAGLSAARGRYVTVLPEGDLALGGWVRVFHDAEPSSDGRILRALGVTQDHELVEVLGHRAVRAQGPPRSISPAHFSLWQHALQPRSPTPSWAWPRALASDRGMHYDIHVADDPDWELLVRAAEQVGVVDLGLVTSLCRHWGAAGPRARSTLGGPTAQELIDSRPLVLPAGESSRLRTGLPETATDRALKDELARTAEELRLTHDHAANLEAIVRNLESQAETAVRRHAKEVARLQRKLGLRTRAESPEAEPPTTASPPARSWRPRLRGHGPGS